MSLYDHFHAAIAFTNLIPFIYMCTYKFEIIMQNPCYERFDEDHFVQSLRTFKITYYSRYILCSNNFLPLPNYTFSS